MIRIQTYQTSGFSVALQADKDLFGGFRVRHKWR